MSSAPAQQDLFQDLNTIALKEQSAMASNTLHAFKENLNFKIFKLRVQQFFAYHFIQ